MALAEACLPPPAWAAMNVAPQALPLPTVPQMGEALGRILYLLGKRGEGDHFIYSFLPQGVGPCARPAGGWGWAGILRDRAS